MLYVRNPLRLSPETAVALLVAAAVCAVLWVPFRRAGDKARQTTCLSTVKIAILALEEYAQDWDDRYPPAAGLAGVQRQYVSKGSSYIEGCPDDRTGQETSYAIPGGWGERIVGEVIVKPGAVLVYEADYGIPAYRHRQGMNVGYADGHGRWRARATLPPEDLLRGVDPQPDAKPRDPWE
jgi:prepilin-type processing-associated H-X9-DG protein